MRYKFLLVFVLCAACLRADQATIDSLKTELETQKDDSKIPGICGALAFAYHIVSPDSAERYAKLGIEKARKLSDTFEEASCLNMLGLAYFRKGWYGLAEEKYNESASLFIKLKERDQESRVYLNLAQLFQNRKDYKKAFEINKKALDYFKEAGDSMHMATAYQSLSIYTRELQQFEESEEYLEHAERILIQLNLIDDIGTNYALKGNLYKAMKKYRMAIEQYHTSMNYYNQANDLANKALSFENLGLAHHELGEYKLAVQHFEAAIDLFKEINSEMDVAYELMLSAPSFAKSGQIEKALLLANNAMNYFVENKVPEYQMECHLILSGLYEESNSPGDALNHYKLYSNLNDSLRKERQSDELARIKAELDDEKKNAEIELLKSEKKTQKTALTLRNALIILLLLLFISLIIGLFYYKKRNTLVRELEKQKMLSRIAGDLHDDVGATLSSISMYGEMIKKQSETRAPELSELASKITRNSRETIKTMSDIVWTLKPGNDNYKALCDRIENFAIELCTPGQIKLHFNGGEINRSIELNSELRSSVYLIAKEAINNSIKYSGTKQLDVFIKYTHENLELIISDYGKGFDLNGKRGNGLENMQKRTLEFGGVFNISTVAGKGTKIEASFRL